LLHSQKDFFICIFKKYSRQLSKSLFLILVIFNFQHPGIKNRPQAVWLKVYSGYFVYPFQAKGDCLATMPIIPTRQMNLISKHFCLDDLISFDLV